MKSPRSTSNLMKLHSGQLEHTPAPPKMNRSLVAVSEG